MMKGIVKVDYNGVSVAFEGKENVSLTSLWEASGKNPSQQPKQWIRFEGKNFINTIADSQKVSVDHLLRTKPGKGGGTWAHWQIALEYARYLSPELAIWTNQVVKERLEEERSPDLAYSRGRERAIRGYKLHGRDDKWINNRLKSMDVNIEHRQVLKDHGVGGVGFSMCANNINCAMLGTTRKKYLENSNLPADANLRDHMDESLIVGEMLAEILSDKKIIKENISGNKSCAKTCYDVAKQISTTINHISNF